MPVRSRRSSRRRFRTFLIWVEVIVLAFLATVIGVVGGAFYHVSKMLPTGIDLETYKPTEATKIFSSDGVLLGQLYEENRETVALTDIPKDLQNATVAIEDWRFYKHLGVDFVGMGRAFFTNLRSGHLSQGGSTITQQLARNIYLTRKKTYFRKLEEIVLAIELERNYSKKQILELYLNEVYYGSRAYGVQAAAKTYFGKDVKNLTLAECALIAGLPQRPSGYSPYEDMDEAVNRRDVVLNRMMELGYITHDQCAEAKASRIRLAGIKPNSMSKYKAPWFVTYVIKQLSDKYGADMVYRGGWHVYTTLNYAMQQVAEQELRSHVAAARGLDVSQGALVCIDPHNGYIRAMVGGASEDFYKDQFNRAVQMRRQPGSSFKAFVYTAAIDNGYDENYRLSNARITYGSGDNAWSPKNYDGKYGGTYTIKKAVAYSVNICAVRMADQIGIDKVISYARLLGIKSPLGRNLSLALGSTGVTPLEMCSAYGVFAADGVRAEPMTVVKITESDKNGDGAVVESNEPVTKQVLSKQTTDIMNDIFRGVVTMGTGIRAKVVPDAHGKTGTTNDDRDAWFVGYTPELVTAIWVGNDNYSKHMRHVFGGTGCIPTWVAYMQQALKINADEKARVSSQSPVVQPSDNADNQDQGRRHRRHRGEETSPDSTNANSGQGSQPGTSSNANPFNSQSQPQNQMPAVSGSSGQSAPPSPASAPAPAPAPVERKHTQAAPSRPAAARNSNEYVSVWICVDSGQIANQYCKERILKRFRIDQAPHTVCKLHHAPD